MNQRIGIIDIGSNSIRLVIYEIISSGEHRVLHEKKYAARLSQYVSPEGAIKREDLNRIIPVLLSYQEICESYGVIHIRTAATAAIRNASNSEEITSWIKEATGLTVELISGEDEGRLGFLGVRESIPLQDGYIIDIGGGSTEITLFLNRQYQFSLSIPYGAVNSHARYGKADYWRQETVHAFKNSIQNALKDQKWLLEHPGLALVGLGGTVRALAKMVQKKRSYSLPLMHAFTMTKEDIQSFYDTLPYIPYEQRKKTPGLSKDRTDLIIPGVILLQTIFELLNATHYVVSGAGLRDGLFFETLHKQHPSFSKQDVLTKSVQNMLIFDSFAPREYLDRIYKDMRQLYASLVTEEQLSDHRIIYAAAMLHRIGERVQHHRASSHSLYWLKNKGLWGLSHRETLICALISDYHPKNRTPKQIEAHKDILAENDTQLIHKIGSLLQLTLALHHGGGRSISNIEIKKTDDSLHLQLSCSREPSVELMELSEVKKEVEKAWNLSLTWSLSLSSTF
ncbi:Ppx/GppA family phosphatase [Neobacillus mesonae]|nr:Ppx/GppA family phosphatase [Neobacillus mesonae]